MKIAQYKRFTRSRFGNVVYFGFLLLAGFLMVVPMAYSIITSFKPLDELMLWPPRFFVMRPTLQNYTVLPTLLSNLNVPLSRYIFNSVFISSVTTFFHIFVASLAAYVLSKTELKGKKIFFLIIQFSLLYNAYTLAIPQYVIFSKTHLINTYLVYILPYLPSSLGVFLIKQYMDDSIPTAILEAAKIDGAGEFKIYWHIVMPVVKPAWMTLVLFAFRDMWSVQSSGTIFNEELKTLPTIMSQINNGGIAGICTALSAARHGISVVLVHDRSVLGGNASSEIRMHICGAHGKDNRETGIVEELILENFYQNPQLKYPLWDSVLYATVMRQSGLTVLLNSSVMDAECENNKIRSVMAWQSNAETFHTIEATYFADCSGDSILAPLSGAEYRYGREAKNEFGETISPDVADKKTMGMSCMFQIRETEHPIEFKKPDWAHTYETDRDLPYKEHDLGTNFWWIEVGGEWDCIHDTDRCREECLKICYGVWDHIKNKGDHGAQNWELEWIGFLPGKRESRRYVGEYTVNQNDVQSEGRFEDLVAYAGWTMDDHFPEGFYYTKGYPTIFHPAPHPW